MRQASLGGLLCHVVRAVPEVGDKIKIIKIDIDKNENIALKYNIRSVPTLMLFINGEMRWRESGAMSCDRLLEILNQHAAF
jgi:thioredoxin 1